MSAISLKSITGITSITTPTGVDNQLTLHTNDTTQRVKVTQSGIEVVGVSTFQDLDVDGHTNLDNVSVAGVSTFSNDVKLEGGLGNLTVEGNTGLTIKNANPRLIFTDTDNNPDFSIRGNGGKLRIVSDTHSADRLIVDSSGNFDILQNLDVRKDLDVDGHTNLDNVSVAGIVTATAFVSNTPLSHRNVIVNGDCLVAQRGTSSASANFASVDRMKMSVTNIDQLAFLQKQTSDGPDGFKKCFEFDVTTAESALDADDLVYMRYAVEAQDLVPFYNANGSGKDFILSFYVKAYQTGTYQISIYQEDTPRFITKTYTVASSATWQRVEIPITGDTGAYPVNADNGLGFQIAFMLAAGTNYTSGSAITSWGSWGGNPSFAAGQSVNVLSSTDNYWRITGIQLELGSVATPFEHRSYADELRRCQRYFFKMYGATGGISTGDGAIATLANFTNTAAYGPIFLPVDMRAAPTPHNPPNYSNLVYYSSGQTFTPSGSQVVFTGAATNRVEIRINSMTNMSAGNAGWLRITSPSGYIEFNAEL